MPREAGYPRPLKKGGPPPGCRPSHILLLKKSRKKATGPPAVGTYRHYVR